MSLIAQEADAREDQRTHRIGRSPLWKRIEQHARERDQERTHDESAEDAPEEHAMLIDTRGTAKGGENQEKDEDVVDAERFLDQVGGGPFDAFVAALEDEDAGIEKEGETDPTRRSRSGLPFCWRRAHRGEEHQGSSATIAQTKARNPIQGRRSGKRDCRAPWLSSSRNGQC